MSLDNQLLLIFIAVILLVILFVAFFIWDSFKNPRPISKENRDTKYVYIEKEKNKNIVDRLIEKPKQKRKEEEERKKRRYDIEKAIRNAR